MAKKIPSFQFYPADWLKDPDLARCTLQAQAVWIRMICFMFECKERGVLSTNDVAWSDEDIARVVGGDQSTILPLIAELLAKGVAKRRKDGAIYSARLVRDEKKRQLCSEAGKRGGNPKLKASTLKGVSKGSAKGVSKRNPTPSSSSSISSSIQKEKQEKEKGNSPLGDADIDPFPTLEPDYPDRESVVIDSGIDHSIDWVTEEHKFLTLYNSKNLAGRTEKRGLPSTLVVPFRRMWSDPEERERMVRSLDKFPLKCGAKITLKKFIDPATIDTLLAGGYDFEPRGSSYKERGDHTSSTSHYDEYMAQSLSNFRRKEGSSSV